MRLDLTSSPFREIPLIPRLLIVQQVYAPAER